MAVYGFEFGTEEYFLLILGELVGLDGGEGFGFFVHGVAEGAHHRFFFTGFVAVFLDARTGEDAIVFAVIHGADAGDAAGAEGGIGPDVVEGDFLGLCGSDVAKGCKGHYDNK